jgi:pimeloyl-ACP methyl ester carboxylesterase
VFASLAEFERNLIRERTLAGLKAARARGRNGARPGKLKSKDIQVIKALMHDLESLARWLHQALRALDLPTLVVWGQRDPYLPTSLAERQKETFPRAQVHGLPNGGHWQFIDAPSVVAEKLAGLLRFHFPTSESQVEREVPQPIGV